MTTAYSGAESPEFRYVGTELELFGRAVRWKAYVRDVIGRYVRGDVLEVGAGLGETTRVLCDGRQRSWLCIEPDAELARELEARLRAASLRPVPAVRVATTADLVGEKDFDAILYIDVLEHIDDDRAEVMRASRLLRRGGALVVLSPAHQLLYSEFDRAIGHYRRYTKARLASLFGAGLVRRRLAYLDSLGFLVSLGNRLLLRQSMPTARQIAFWDGLVVPASRVADRLTLHRFGRSVVAVYERV